MRAVPGPTILRGDGHYGNALLTSRPVGDIRRLDLSVPGREPRGALDVTIAVRRGKTVRVVVTHLGLIRSLVPGADVGNTGHLTLEAEALLASPSPVAREEDPTRVL